VPVGTPIENTNRRFVNLPTPLPATGPYEIASYSPAHEVRLVRNPYFREWSHAARPDGYPDQIVWRIGASPSAAVTAVEQDRADYTVDSPPPDRLVEVQTRFAGQLKANPNDITAVLFLNTHTPPFNDLRVRRALNYAVDRRRVAGLIGQASQPTCQLLPPFVPGYERYCPFTLGPNRSGAWNAPDLARARALIGASHTRGTKVTIWSQPSLGIDYTAAGRYLASLLDRLGYRSQLTSSSALAPDTPDWWRQGQAAFQTAAPGSPAASEFIHAYLACQYLPRSSSSFSLNISEFCSLGPEATMRQAFAAEAANSPVAADLWARADRQVTDDAPLVPLVTPWTLDFVARRVGNYQYHPQQGILIDQLWVR
jgi:peptide/nickel transport system substrate-binding protein